VRINKKLTEPVSTQVAHKNNPSSDNPRLIFLDYLRIFAFSSVLIGHKYWDQLLAFVANEAVPAAPRTIANFLLPLVEGGSAGVTVFFLVSGYIITYILQNETTTEFIIKRIFRIYPLYCVAVLLQNLPTLILAPENLSWLTLLQQLSLMGDFFATPYALNGAEWTLRLEIIFYIVMASFHAMGLTTHYKKTLPYIFIAIALLCWTVDPIPTASPAFTGYFTMYFLFFLLGAMFYLYQVRQIRATFLLLFSVFIFYAHYSMMASYWGKWLHDQSAIPAFFIFAIAWMFRKHMTADPWVLFLSNMTYAVYLFHNWLIDYIKFFLVGLNIPALYADVHALILMLLVCFLMTKYVEASGIRLGRYLLRRVKR
jgi:peptidoglycan/LPS O-acetylase OafA/YrhL